MVRRGCAPVFFTAILSAVVVGADASAEADGRSINRGQSAINFNAERDPIGWSQRGMSVTNGKYCPEVRFGSEASAVSQRNLAATGTNFVALIVTEFQDTINSTVISPWHPKTATDLELRRAIRLSRLNLGQRVMLKPHIDLRADPLHWRGDIGSMFDSAFPDPESMWDKWFVSYTRFIVKYAQLAAEEGVEQFSLGCELIATSPQESHWRSVAREVRRVFPGQITYAANWGGEETNKTWWDAVDLIGVDAYYPIAPKRARPTVADMVAFWEEIRDIGIHNGVNGGYMSTSLKNLSVFWSKPMIFTEIGYCSGNCTKGPEIDDLFQTEHFEAVFEAWGNVPWFHGAFWWNWATDPAFGSGEFAPQHGANCCTPQWKPAQRLLVKYYGGDGKFVKPSSPPLCTCIL